MGGSFCEPIEVKSKQHIGVAYQIPHFGPVNTSTTFHVQVQLTMLYAIDDRTSTST